MGLLWIHGCRIKTLAYLAILVFLFQCTTEIAYLFTKGRTDVASSCLKSILLSWDTTVYRLMGSTGCSSGIGNLLA